MSNGTCAGCGAEAKNKYCSRSCYNANRPKVSDQPSRNDCEVCGEAIRPKPGKRFCSRICKRRSVNGFRPKSIQCAECGATVEAVGTGNANRKYCDRACLQRHRERQSGLVGSPKYRDAQRRLDRAALGTKGIVRVAGPCSECGVPTVWPMRNLGAQTGNTYCSKRCSRRVAARARRRRLREAPLEYSPSGTPIPVLYREIALRDEGLCQLCGFPVNEDAEVPALDAPVLDHIVALALGGSHGPSNVQLAHFLCNSYKGMEEAKPFINAA